MVSMTSRSLSEVMSALIAAGILKSFRAGDTIVGERSYVNSVPMVVSGTVKVIRSDAERELVLYYLQPGDGCVMSFMASLFNDTHNVRMVAEEPCQVSFVPIDLVQQALREHPSLMLSMVQTYHKRFGELLDLVDDIAFRKLDERLAQYLERKAALTGSRSIHLTHEQIAQELGTAREVVSRLLKQMESKGLLEISRNRIEIR